MIKVTIISRSHGGCLGAMWLNPYHVTEIRPYIMFERGADWYVHATEEGKQRAVETDAKLRLIKAVIKYMPDPPVWDTLEVEETVEQVAEMLTQSMRPVVAGISEQHVNHLIMKAIANHGHSAPHAGGDLFR